MNIGFLFPGQGTQSVGMGKDIYEQYEKARDIYEKVKSITDIDISKISFEGPTEILNETENTQLAILTMSLAILEVLKQNGIQAKSSAGLSLGEYTALINSEAITFDQGVNIVKKRGEFMQKYLPKGNWQMSAIIGLSDEQVEEACKKAKNGFVVPANYNCKGQVAISGEKEAIMEAEQIAKDMGAKKVIPLKTAGPFHTARLLESSKALRKELDKLEIHEFKTKVIKNLDGTEYKPNDDVKEILEKHIISPVRFSKTIENMLNDGIDTFVEIGPGKTLSGFVKRTNTDKKIDIINISNAEELKQAIMMLKQN